jgi:hypothetical protein
MLCDLAVHLTPEGTYMLRVSGTTSVGRSGTGGQDAKYYPTAHALLEELKTLGLSHNVRMAAAHELINPETRKRYINIADKVQICFELLERADIYLFD